MIVTLTVTCFVLNYITKVSQRAKKETKKELVSTYLEGFDTQDIKVSISETGGYQCTYVGKLVDEAI